MAHCNSCGTDAAIRVRTVFTKDGEFDSCSECEGIKPSYARDAAGQRVYVPTESLGRYSYAIDGPVTSTHQFANRLRELGLGQKQ